MTIKHTSFFLFILTIAGCVKAKQKDENPYEVAKEYCSCIEKQIKNYKDSLIDTYKCEKEIFSKSRMMEIPYSDERNNKLTADSAFNFIIEVRNITDTMCMDKLDFKKLKNRPHIRL